MRRIWIIVAVALTLTLVALIALTAVLTPGALNPAFDIALKFTDAVLETRDDAAAASVLSPQLAAWVDANCPEGVSACIQAYIPDEWGGFVDAVYRRSIPDGKIAWDVQVIATFDEKLTAGFSGVCIYLRVVDAGTDGWQIDRWAGWTSCDEPNAGLEQMRANADAPNRAP